MTGRQCSVCGKPVGRAPSGRGRIPTYCSRSCHDRAKYRRKKNRLDAAEATLAEARRLAYLLVQQEHPIDREATVVALLNLLREEPA